jgi:hypothetical protein
MEDTPIKKTLRRLEGCEFKIVWRGDVVKIPAQIIKLPEKDGVITTYEIPADITG